MKIFLGCETDSFWVDFQYEQLVEFSLLCGLLSPSQKDCLESSKYKKYGPWLQANAMIGGKLGKKFVESVSRESSHFLTILNTSHAPWDRVVGVARVVVPPPLPPVGDDIGINNLHKVTVTEAVITDGNLALQNGNMLLNWAIGGTLGQMCGANDTKVVLNEENTIGLDIGAYVTATSSEVAKSVPVIKNLITNSSIGHSTSIKAIHVSKAKLNRGPTRKRSLVSNFVFLAVEKHTRYDTPNSSFSLHKIMVESIFPAPPQAM